ncbi:hypothetical protein TNCV_1004791 [Trichonephila clavipes]|nr:hypothetical protein TNCV_1004791 [Trichonephila clavipes]
MHAYGFRIHKIYRLQLRSNPQPWVIESSREVGGRGREVGGPSSPQDILPQNWDGLEQNRTVTCMVLQTKANDSLSPALRRDQFRGP